MFLSDVYDIKDRWNGAWASRGCIPISNKSDITTVEGQICDVQTVMGRKKIISGSHMSKNVPFWPLFPPEWTHVVKVSWTPPPPLGEHENTQKGSLVLRNVSLRKGIWLSVLLLKSNSCNHRKPHLYFQDVNYRCHYLYTLLLSFLPFCFLYFSHLDSAVNCHPRLLLLTCPCSI